MSDPYGPQWQPIEQLDSVLGLVRGMTEETREQRGLYRESGVATLDAPTIARIRRAFADRLDLIALFRQQLDRWRKERLTPSQIWKLEEFKLLLDEDERLSREIQMMFGSGSPHDRARSGGN
jgi:hypothetical protein